MTSKEAHGHTWAMVCHLATFAGWIIPFGNILGPLVAWLAEREEHPHINDQGKEAVNFNISVTIYSIILGIVAVAGFVAALATNMIASLLGLIALIGVIVLLFFHFIFTLIAAYRAQHGIKYRYPLTIRFIK
ncbi:MAG: DUF4870 domain-containing protein [Candidatus Magasanikbacteria bacterium]|nr:DUF4870 domain-containing protein [Candidatus Magasanikbacteria bacterium]